MKAVKVAIPALGVSPSVESLASLGVVSYGWGGSFSAIKNGRDNK